MVVAKESFWKMRYCAQMEEGNPVTGDTLKG